MTIEEYLQRVGTRPLPSNPMARVKTFARELAEGASYDLWGTTISIYFPREESETKGPLPDNENLREYVKTRWGISGHPGYDMLLRQEYLALDSSDWFRAYYTFTKSAFDLLEEVDHASVFVSYKRSESSAFALLIAKVLEQAGLAPFIDMQLRPGDDWRDELERNVKGADYFVLLLGHDTLASDVTMQELQWALDAGKSIITIRHNSFKFEDVDWDALPKTISEAIQRTHSIEVTQENPLAYNTALTELLNRFGITP